MQIMTKRTGIFLILVLSGLVSCGSGGLGVAALLGGTSGAGGQGLNDGFTDAEAEESLSEDDDLNADDDVDAGDVMSTTYYVDENGNTVEVAVDDGTTSYADQNVFDADAVADESGMPVDAEETVASGADGVSDANNGMTDEQSEYGSTELDPIEVASLPVTLPKDDGSDDEGSGDGDGSSDADCTSENHEAVSLSYESGDAHYMMMPEEDGSASHSRTRSGANRWKSELLRQTEGGSEVSDRMVFIPSRKLLNEEDSDVTPLQCQSDDPGIEDGTKLDELSYAWRVMLDDSFGDYEMEAGTFRVNEAGGLELGERATVMHFIGQNGTFRLSRDDFGLSRTESDAVPYLILRPSGF